MRFTLLLSVLLLATGCSHALNPHGADVEDNDFAEFEEFEDEDFGVDENANKDNARSAAAAEEFDEENLNDAEMNDDDDDEVTVEDDDDEFEHLQDEDEFIGFDERETPKKKGTEKPPDLKINKVPYHLRTNWDSFYLEMLMLAGLGVYFLNFLHGKSKNSRLAQAWLEAHKNLLEANFSIVGDDGLSTDVSSGVMMKESENIYNLWCSGRSCCEGMLVTLKLLKRQDLISTISRMFKPVSDQISVKVTMDEAEMDTFIFFLANKKICSKMQKDMTDLSQYCIERKAGEKYGVPKSFQILVDPAEVVNQVLDTRIIAAMNKYEDMIEYLHFSDQYCGPKQQEDSDVKKAPDTQKVLIFAFNVPGQGKCTTHDMEKVEPLMKMVFHCIDKMRRIRLSKEAKLKTERKRQKIEESYLKASHDERMEAAQTRREEKRRAEKEKIMADDDPDKQRKWEDRENRRDLKKKQAKAKMMKVKAM